MSFSQRHFQQPLYSSHQQNQNPSNLCSIDGQAAPAFCFNASTVHDQSQHPPYIPPFHVAGLAPGPILTADGTDEGGGSQWNYGLEPKRQRVKERDFLENNSQISSVDYLQGRSVSTGLGLSLDNTRMSSTCDSALLSIIGDDIDRELKRQDLEIESFLKIQGNRLRQAILDKVQSNQLQAIAHVEEKVLQKLREKEAEVQNINKRNLELEDRMDQLTTQATAWQQRAQFNENMINLLKFNLQQVHAQSRDSKEGCGDSEIDDTASCCNGRGTDFHLLCKENNGLKTTMTCKVCRMKEVCMLLLPCKHLCLCKDCESKISVCPLCQSSKLLGMEVYM